MLTTKNPRLRHDRTITIRARKQRRRRLRVPRAVLLQKDAVDGIAGLVANTAAPEVHDGAQVGARAAVAAVHDGFVVAGAGGEGGCGRG